MKDLIIGETANVIKSEGWSVRVVELDDGRWYSITDIYRLCGYKAPEKIMYRDKKSGKEIGNIQKILYPVFTKRGIRRFHMAFGDKACLENIVRMYPCGEECKQWLFNKVVQQEDEKPAEDIANEVVEPNKVATQDEAETWNERATSNGLSAEALNKAVDRMLIEILELKKQLAAVVA